MKQDLVSHQLVATVRLRRWPRTDLPSFRPTGGMLHPIAPAGEQSVRSSSNIIPQLRDDAEFLRGRQAAEARNINAHGNNLCHTRESSRDDLRQDAWHHRTTAHCNNTCESGTSEVPCEAFTRTTTRCSPPATPYKAAWLRARIPLFRTHIPAVRPQYHSANGDPSLLTRRVKTLRRMIRPVNHGCSWRPTRRFSVEIRGQTDLQQVDPLTLKTLPSPQRSRRALENLRTKNRSPQVNGQSSGLTPGLFSSDRQFLQQVATGLHSAPSLQPRRARHPHGAVRGQFGATLDPSLCCLCRITQFGLLLCWVRCSDPKR